MYIVVTVTVIIRRVCMLASSEKDTLNQADGKRERLQPKPVIGFHLTLLNPQTPQGQQSPALNTLHSEYRLLIGCLCQELPHSLIA